jgi:hypothetical protein
MNPLQQAAVRRKIGYFVAILVLFTLSMFWRGTIDIPLAGKARAADVVASATIQQQATRLELRELEQGDPELAGAAIRLLMTGSRGLAVTILWQAALEKQKRNDFHEFEVLVQTITKLQPHFITPWIYQSWNIAYNVSVEQDKLNDMYFYIARGIELLAEGERRNRRSPDMRYQVAFYYQNKFGVSDKVQTLRCLFQLSCMPPAERNTAPGTLTNADGSVNMQAFEKFCQDHPHLVRRLRDKLNCKKPSDVVDFLRDNKTVPTRYKNATDLADADRQFPTLPQKFEEGRDEAHPGIETKDDFTGFRAARAWFAYANLLVPPNPTDEEGRPIPSPTPRLTPEEQFKYRIPRLPMLIIFRQGPPRAQSYQAELQGKEGWYDEEGWRVDEGVDEQDQWFPGREPGKEVVLGTGRAWSRLEWEEAARMWQRHGDAYALSLDTARLNQFQRDFQSVPSLPNDPEGVSDPLVLRAMRARTALQFYSQNRSVTNYAYFRAQAEAEALRGTVEARKILWKADQARKSVGGKLLAIKLYKEGLARWKQVLEQNPAFHRPEGSERTEEETYEYEIEYLRLAGDDPAVREKAKQEYHKALRAVVPFQPIATKETREYESALLAVIPILHNVTAEVEIPAAGREELYADIAERFFSPFAQLMPSGDPWVRADVKNVIRSRQGTASKPQQQQQPGTPPPPPPTPPVRPSSP